MAARLPFGAFGYGLAQGLDTRRNVNRTSEKVIDVECEEVTPELVRLPSPDDEKLVRFDNPSYRDYLIRKAGEAVSPEERERLLALADGRQVAPNYPHTIELLRALIRQIELGSYTDDHGHKLTNNVHFIKAKEAVGE